MKGNNGILAQVSCSKHDLDDIFAQSSNTPYLSSTSSSSTSSSSATLTAPEIQSIFEGKEKFDLSWFVNKGSRRKGAKCCTCRSTMPEGKIFLSAIGYYIPPNETFAIEITIYFCLMKSCVSRKSFMSSIAVPPQSVCIASFAALTADDIDIISSANVALILFSMFFFSCL